MIAVLASLVLLVPSASATFEATMAARGGGRAGGPTFIVEAGGGRSTRIRNLEVPQGRCGSIFAALIEAGHTTAGFAGGNGVAIFTSSGVGLKLRLELRVKPRGEGLTGSGIFDATLDGCHERLPLDLVSAEIRGGGRQGQG